MTTLTFPELDELEGKIAKVAKDAHDFTEEAKGPDGVLDLRLVKSIPGTSTEKAAWFQERQTELNDLQDQAVPLRAIKATAIKGSDDDNELDDVDEDGRFEKDGGGKRTKSYGRQMAEAIKAGGDVKRFKYTIEGVDIKTLMTSAAGWPLSLVRGPRVVDFATRPLEVLDLFPTRPTNLSSWSFMEETTFTNAAAERNEGAAKAESALALTERTALTRSVATNLPVTDEQLEDVDGLEAYLNRRLGFFVRQRLEGQILVGDGIAPNIKGILNVAGIQTQPKGADPTPDAIYKAMVLVMTTGQAQPDGVIMNPLDWQDVRLLRTADGIYIWGNPSDAGPQRIWGLPVALSQAETLNTGIVGAFQIFTELAIKKDVTIERGYINDDFTKDISRFRAEMRVSFNVFRPSAICTVTGI